ncbi:MAG TPA: rod-binding protein [Alphaproteobacteria bacterium]
MSNIFAGSDPLLSRMASADIAMVKAKSGLDAKKLQEVDAAAKDFEAMFIGEMLKPMFETVQTDELFGGGEAEDTWKGLMVEEYGKQITRSGGIGLSDDIKTKMIEMQEQALGEKL